MSKDAHSRDLRLHRLADASATFFVTKSLQPKKQVLTPGLRAIISDAFVFAVQRERIYLRSFVVMPDHWHALVALREPWTLPKFMHSLMSYIGGKTSHALAAAQTQWQDGYYETWVKTAKQFHFVSEYILANPVKKGFVSVAEEWDASSLKRPEIIAEPWPFLLDNN
jgi:REP element-mobilizing transposase RayT